MDGLSRIVHRLIVFIPQHGYIDHHVDAGRHHKQCNAQQRIIKHGGEASAQSGLAELAFVFGKNDHDVFCLINGPQTITEFHRFPAFKAPLNCAKALTLRFAGR